MAILDNFYEFCTCAMAPLVAKLYAQYLEKRKRFFKNSKFYDNHFQMSNLQV